MEGRGESNTVSSEVSARVSGKRAAALSAGAGAAYDSDETSVAVHALDVRMNLYHTHTSSFKNAPQR